MRTFSSFAFATAVCLSASGQAPDWVWGVNAVGDQWSHEGFSSIATDGAGNLFLTGTTTSDTVTLGEIVLPHTGHYMAMLNYAGTYIWAEPLSASLGSLWTASDGSVRFSRMVNSSISLPDQEIVVVGGWAVVTGMITDSGIIQDVVLQDSLFDASTQPTDIIFHPEIADGLYIAGSYTNSLMVGDTILFGGASERFLCRFGNDGQFDWVNGIATGVQLGDLDVGADGACYLTGLGVDGQPVMGDSILTDAVPGSYVCKVGLDGLVSWVYATAMGWPYWAYWDLMVDDQGRVFCGDYNFLGDGNYTDAVTCISPAGSFAWQAITTTSWPTSHGEEGMLLEDPEGGAFICGYAIGPTTFGSHLFDAGGCPYVFVAHLDTSGGWNWVIDAEVGCNVWGRKLVRDPGGNLYCMGRGSGSFEIGYSTFLNTSESDGWIGKLSSLPLGGDALSANFNDRVEIFPNPANDNIRVELPALQGFTLTDALGRVVRTSLRPEASVVVDITALPVGVYMIRSGRYSGRFIKE